ncbi:hypothetical protein M434DRAFT_28857 [Hypoxylon sp. CO27-5]|nr:hypothetical protein M434DRAFT_28857 [Hypoxylon sp. CO27-5]
MSDQTRTIFLYEGADDLRILEESNMTFQLANGVLGRDGEISWNVVWQSRVRCPTTEISWKPNYALNWTMNVPEGGFTVNMGGLWQRCELGQSFDIESTGLFTPSVDTSSSRPGFLNIGKNKFNAQGQGQIHIVIGLQNSHGSYDPIWIDLVGLGKNMSSWYQPQEQCQWWYETGMRSSTMISGARTEPHKYDMSRKNQATGRFYVATTYSYEKGDWKDSPTRPGDLARLLSGSADSELKLLQNQIFSIEKLLGTLMSKVGIRSPMFYIGHIGWYRPESEEFKNAKNLEVANYLSDNYGYDTTVEWHNDTIALILILDPRGMPPYTHVPLSVKNHWKAAFAQLGGIVHATDLGVSLHRDPDEV